MTHDMTSPPPARVPSEPASAALPPVKSPPKRRDDPRRVRGRKALFAVTALALQLGACGGGGGDADSGEPAAQNNAPAAPASVSLPAVSSRYVRSEGTFRMLAVAPDEDLLRTNFIRLFGLCNLGRVAYDQAVQDLPSGLLDSLNRTSREVMYDAATGAARHVEYGLPKVTLNDVTAATRERRAPNCLDYTVDQVVNTEIWSTDGYRYKFEIHSDPRERSTARRYRFNHPDDLSWRVLPVDLSAQPLSTIAGASCRDFPRVVHALGSSEECRMLPDDAVVFRVLPITLREAVVTSLSNGQPTPGSIEVSYTATFATTVRSQFAEWANQPVDTLPELPPGVTITDR